MTFSIASLGKAVPAVLVGVALMVTGCSDATTRDDVSDAREELRDEQEDVAVARADAQEDIADAREEAQEYTVAKPVLDEDAVEAQQDLAETRQDAAEDIADEREDVQTAVAELRTEEQRLQATQARDTYVKHVETRLAAMVKNIDQLETQAGNVDGAEKEALDLRIEALEAKHDRAEEALETLKSADLATWENHKEHVRTAMQDAESVGTVR